MHQENVNEEKQGTSYFESEVVRERVQDFHSDDVALYEKALSIRAAQRAAQAAV